MVITPLCFRIPRTSLSGDDVMKIKSIELIHLDVPFTKHTEQHMKYWLPHWRITQICRLSMDNGIVGIGETIPNYTWSRVPDDIEARVVGREAAQLLWDDNLGAGVQMALFDAVGKHENVPIYQLLGTKVRDHVPLSWWGMDMPPRDGARQCADAVKAGYMSAKLKARTWYDLHAAIRAIIKATPPQFRLDFDYNATLDNAANAVEHLKSLEQYPQVAMIESPIPQDDVAGNRHIRDRIDRPVAMHFGSPPIATCLKEDVADGFVVCAGASAIRSQAAHRQSGQQALLAAACRHWSHDHLGSPPRRRMHRRKVAGHYLHEHLEGAAHQTRDRAPRRLSPRPGSSWPRRCPRRSCS